MTALCPNNGPSGPLPGVPEIVTVSMVAIESTLILGGQPELAALLAPFLASVPFEAATFCSTDPPPDPGLTPTDVVDAINTANIARMLPAQAKIQQWWSRFYWFKICG